MCVCQEKIQQKDMQFYKIREIAFGGGTKLSAEDGFLQFMIDRLLASDAPAEEAEDEDKEELGDDMNDH